MPPDERLRALLSRVRLVLRLRAALFGLEASCALGLFLALVFAGLSALFGMRGHAWALVPALSVSAGFVAAGVLLAGRKMGPVYLAWIIERGCSGFDSLLITAAELLEVSPLPGEARVLLSQLEKKLDAVSPSRLPRARAEVIARVALAASLALSAVLTVVSGGRVVDSACEFFWGNPAPQLRVVTVHPGSVEIEEGDELRVVALVSGGAESARLRVCGEGFPMAREGGVWRASIAPGVGLEYAIEARRGKALARSQEFSVRVLPPVEVTLTFRLRPPRYTRLKELLVHGPDVRVPEGSGLEAVLTGEREARFTFDGRAYRMRRDADGSLRARLRPVRSGAYELEHPRGTLSGTVVVVQDSRPELSVRAEGLQGERLAMRVRAADDYGLGECTVHVSARGLSKEFRVPVPEAALEYSKKLFLPESFTSSLPDGTEVVYWAEVRDLSPERHVTRTEIRKWTLRRPESRTPLFASRRPKRKLREKPRPARGGEPPPPRKGGTARGVETLEEERPPERAPATKGEREAPDYVSEQKSPERKETAEGGAGAGAGRPSPRDAGAEGTGKGARPTSGKGGSGSAGGTEGVKRPRDGGPKTGREEGPGPDGEETVDKRLVDAVVPDAEELARALAARKGGDVGGGRGKRAREAGEDASALPQAERLAGKLGFSEGVGAVGARVAGDYDELYRALVREYFRRLARRDR